MKPKKESTCAICEQERWGRDGWFLLVDSHWQDRLKILEWNDQIATQPGIFCACSALHVEQLVIHWMTAGSLDYPFALPPQEIRTRNARPRPTASARSQAVDTNGGRLIGELAVDRESMLRILNDSPQSLTAVMEALVGALRRESPSDASSLEYEELELCSPHREV